MRLIPIVLCLVPLVATSVASAQTGTRKSSSPPNANTVPARADPVVEFEKIVKRCSAAIEASNSPAVSVYAKGNEWIRRVRSFDVRYDVKKTESMVAPVIGMVEIQSLAGLGRSSTELGAQELSFTAESADSAVRNRYRLNFVWRDDQWSYKDGTSVLDFRRPDGSYGNTMNSSVDAAKGPAYYGAVGQCFP